MTEVYETTDITTETIKKFKPKKVKGAIGRPINPNKRITQSIIINQIDTQNISNKEKYKLVCEYIVKNNDKCGVLLNYKDKLIKDMLTIIKPDNQKIELDNLLTNTELTDNQYICLYLSQVLVCCAFELLIKKVDTYSVSEKDKEENNNYCICNEDFVEIVFNNYSKNQFGTNRYKITDKRFCDCCKSIEIDKYLITNSWTGIVISNKRKQNNYRNLVYLHYLKKRVSYTETKKIMGNRKKVINLDNSFKDYVDTF